MDSWDYLRAKDDGIKPTDYWNLDAATVVLIALRLRAMIKGMERCGATPSVYYDIDDKGNFIRSDSSISMESSGELSTDDEDPSWTGWHKVLKKMQYAFDTMEANTYGVHSSILDGLNDEEKQKVKDGLLLFAKNFFSLWC